MLTRKQLLKRTLTYHEDDAEYAKDKERSVRGGFLQYVVTAFSGANTEPSHSAQNQDLTDYDKKRIDDVAPMRGQESDGTIVYDEENMKTCDHSGSSTKKYVPEVEISSESDCHDGSNDDEPVMDLDDDSVNTEVTMVKEDIASLDKSNDEVGSGGMEESEEFSTTEKNILSGMKEKGGSKQLRSAMSIADLRSAYQERKKKTMRFSSTVHVCLVPTREELKNIFDELYFRAEDFAHFKREAVTELREVLTRLGITSKQAIKLLYQPNADDADKERISTSVHYNTIQEGPSLSDDEDLSDKSNSVNSGDHKQKAQRAEEEMDTSIDTDPNPSNYNRDLEEERNSSEIDVCETLSSGSQAEETACSDILGNENNFELITGNDEGPSLSDDEEESRKYEESVNRKIMSSAPFLTGVKTDVELNMSSLQSSDKIHLPSKTPSGGGARAHFGEKQMWEVAWRKKMTKKESIR